MNERHDAFTQRLIREAKLQGWANRIAWTAFVLGLANLGFNVWLLLR